MAKKKTISRIGPEDFLEKPPEPKRKKYDFEPIYKLYPRKMGKFDAFAVLKETVLTDEDYRLLRVAVERYVAHLREQNTGPEYIKYFSSFIGTRKVPRWRDWCDEDTGQVETLSSDQAEELNNIFSLGKRNEDAP